MAEEFKAKIYKDEQGRKHLSIQGRAEEIIHPDGRKDVIIHAPSLAIIKQFVEDNQDKLKDVIVDKPK